MCRGQWGLKSDNVVSFSEFFGYYDMRLPGQLALVFFFISITSFGQISSFEGITGRSPLYPETIPGTQLRHLASPIENMVMTRYYVGRKLYSGEILDTIGSVIHATIRDGRVQSFSSETPRWVYRYTIVSSQKFAWYAIDSTIFDGKLIERSEYYMDSLGVYQCTITNFYNDSYEVKRLQFGERKKKKDKFIEPIPNGLQEFHWDKSGSRVEEFHSGIKKGIYEVRDTTGRILSRSYFDPYSGFNGEYISVNLEERIEMRGQYFHDLSIGRWNSYDFDSGKLLGSYWYNGTGNLDSSKSWYPSGKLKSVYYCYSSTSQVHHDIILLICYEKSWYENGNIREYKNLTAGYRPPIDTQSITYYENGFPRLLNGNYNGLSRTVSWYNNGSMQFEKYANRNNYRDSLYREWDMQGNLILESYYDDGKFTNSLINTKYRGNYNHYPALSTFTISDFTRLNTTTWDTGFYVPANIIDSVSFEISNLVNTLRQSNPERSALPSQLERAYNLSDSAGTSKYGYKLWLMNLDTCSCVNGRIFTNDKELNEFLDSTHLICEWQPYVKSRGKWFSQNYFAAVYSYDTVANLSYINRRLNSLQNGSRAEYERRAKSSFDDSLIYYPQGSKTNFGVLPFTVIALAFENRPVQYDKIIYDGRLFHTYIVYADGEIDYFGALYIEMLILKFGIERDR